METTVFGLDVRADRALSFLEKAAAEPTDRGLDVSLAADVEELGWPKGAELISDQRHPDGTVIYQIEASPEAGYRIWGPEYGASILAGDGRRLRGAPGSGGIKAWQRMLIAQALPFAAVLQGLEVLHASAVTVDGGVVAFVGPSGAGKTSLALALCRRGTGFLTDDVLALERVGGELIGHPGTPVTGINQAEAARLRRTKEITAQEMLSVDSREQVARMPVVAEPKPLRALFFLDRRPEGPKSPRFEPAADSQMLMAATFNFVLATPERLCGLLEVCSLAAQRQVERIITGPATDVSELSVAVEQRLSSTT